MNQLGGVLRVEHDLDDNEPGYSFESNGNIISCVNGNDREERRRFTACHEAAHIDLKFPSEHTHGPWWSYAKRSTRTKSFAMFSPPNCCFPTISSSRWSTSPTLSLAVVDRLAKDFRRLFDHATGSRFATLASAPCAFVLSEQGKVRYASRSTALRDANAWVPSGRRCRKAPCPNGFAPVASATAQKKSRPTSGSTIGSRGGALLEDARHPSNGIRTLALLWFEDEEIPAPQHDRRQARGRRVRSRRTGRRAALAGQEAAQIAMAASYLAFPVSQA